MFGLLVSVFVGCSCLLLGLFVCFALFCCVCLACFVRINFCVFACLIVCFVVSCCFVWCGVFVVLFVYLLVLFVAAFSCFLLGFFGCLFVCSFVCLFVRVSFQGSGTNWRFFSGKAELDFSWQGPHGPPTSSKVPSKSPPKQPHCRIDESQMCSVTGKMTGCRSLV